MMIIDGHSTHILHPIPTSYSKGNTIVMLPKQFIKNSSPESIETEKNIKLYSSMHHIGDQIKITTSIYMRQLCEGWIGLRWRRQKILIIIKKNERE